MLNAGLGKLWRAERSQELVAALLGVSVRSFQRFERDGANSGPLLRAVQFCYWLETISAVFIVEPQKRRVVWRNALAAAVGVGDVGATFFGGYFMSDASAQVVMTPDEFLVRRAASTAPPTQRPMMIYYWRAADSVLFQARFLDVHLRFTWEKTPLIYGAFQPTRVAGT